MTSTLRHAPMALALTLSLGLPSSAQVTVGGVPMFVVVSRVLLPA